MERFRSRMRESEPPRLPLAPVGWVLLGAFTVAVAVATAVFYSGWHLLHAHGLQPQHRLSSDTLFDLVKLAFGVVAGSGALVALVVAFRKQIVDEDGALREATRLHTERFTTAVSQIGDASPAVRLGGVHALAGLADDAPTSHLRQTCIDVLCAYLRLPYTAESDVPPNNPAAQQDFLANREVRHTVIRIIGDHLRNEDLRSWTAYDLDFTGVVFDGGDFAGARFEGNRVSFNRAQFTSGRVFFSYAFFADDVTFEGARFTGGVVDFTGAIFYKLASFMRARFLGSVVAFPGARFCGLAAFGDTEFAGRPVSFEGAEFRGNSASFRDALFTRGPVSFDGAEFEHLQVDFAQADLTSGAVSFRNVLLNHGATLDFSQASGPRPDGLPPSTGTVPAGLMLAPGW